MNTKIENGKFLCKANSPISLLAAAVLLATQAQGVGAAVTDIANAPLTVGGSSSNKPNIAFIVDDSGSMDDENMPDSTSTNRTSRCWGWHKYNTLFYNPAYTYKPPYKPDGAKYTDDVTRFPDASFTAALKDGYFPEDGYTYNGTSTSNTKVDLSVVGNLTVGLSTCSRQTASISFNSLTSGADGFYYATSLKVNGVELFDSSSSAIPSTSGTSDRDFLGQKMVDAVNARTDTTGYHATYSSSSDTLTLYAGTDLSGIEPVPTFAKASGGNKTVVAAVNAFSGTAECPSSTVNKTRYYYSTHKTSTTSSTCQTDDNYNIITRSSDIAAPGVATGSAAALTNYANWYSYYRKRAYLMKASAAAAFSGLSDGYRAGLFFLNSQESGSKASTDGKAVNNDLTIGDFSGAQRSNWFARLFGNRASGYTPLRGALSRMGRMYAGKISGWDPVQYSCQQNFAILSTDGYWNTDYETNAFGPIDIDGNNVGNQDGTASRPYSDGADVQNQKRTSTLQQRNFQKQQDVGTLQKQVSEQQSRIRTLQTRTSNNSGSTWTAWSDVNSCTPDNSGPSRRQCQYSAWSSWAVFPGPAACSNVAADTTAPYNVPSARECQTAVVAAYANSASCTPTTVPDDNGQTTQCQYSWQNSQNTASCSSPAYVPNDYSNVTVYRNCATNGTTAWTDVASCTASAEDAGGASTECRYTAWSAWSNVSSCTEQVQSAGPNYVGPAVECQGLASGGTSNTLADVAYYYYKTDLRTTARLNCSNTIGEVTYENLCDNNVLGSGKDTNAQQHMTTHTIGLGVSGKVLYEPNYETAAKDTNNTTLQYYDILNGSGTWPDPNSGDDEKIDDLWHAAVNGRGKYYSASNADTLEAGIKGALNEIKVKDGSSAAAATSNLEPVATDNYVYVALYRTVWWDGDLKAYTIDPNSGALSTSSEWSAQAKLDAIVAAATAGNDGRTIKYFNADATDKLKDFTYTNLEADDKDGLFASKCSAAVLSQCSTGSILTDGQDGQKTLADSAENMIKYLRGQRTYEAEAGNTNPLYRNREHVLGDIVNGMPVYAKIPPFAYDKYDTTYGGFKTDNKSRLGVVYLAANDGMLHAINATGETADRGKEIWAYVPSFVMPNMYRLADSTYGSNHRYFVDGSPTVADICTSPSTEDASLCSSKSDWKTILVGGLNKGGCGYYALDVTNPNNPKGLWEFSDPNLGYSFGNPIVTKRKDGKWVVIVSSGYNNVPGNDCGSTEGDGNGHVFVLDAASGELLDDIPTYTSGTTAAGSAATPSGLAKLNAWVDNENLNVASRVYGADLLGNLWRIDFDDNYGDSGKEATLLAQFVDGSYAQPVTIKPELAEVTVNGVAYPVVMVGTGKYLGTNDGSTTDTDQQSIYAVKDTLTSSGHGSVRGATNFLSRTLVQTEIDGRVVRTVSGDAINWAENIGWYIDLNPSNESPTERVNVDMQLQFNILTVASNVPESDVCTEGGGYSWLYFINIDNGKNLSTMANSVVGIRLSNNSMTAGIKTVKLANGKTVTIVTDVGGGIRVEDNPSATGSAAGAARRTMWREIQE